MTAPDSGWRYYRVNAQGESEEYQPTAEEQAAFERARADWDDELCYPKWRAKQVRGFKTDTAMKDAALALPPEALADAREKVRAWFEGEINGEALAAALVTLGVPADAAEALVARERKRNPEMALRHRLGITRILKPGDWQ
jgi:hypothetical protein